VRGPGAQYFEVTEVQSNVESAEQSRDHGFAAARQELEKELKEEDKKARSKITKPDKACEPNLWLRQVGWVSHLARLDYKELKELVAPVEEDEPELQILSKAFD